MTPEEFSDWIALFNLATGCEPIRTSEILAANREIICERWRATAAELGEVTNNLIEQRVQLNFSDRVVKAIGDELFRLRAMNQPTDVKCWTTPYPVPSPEELAEAKALNRKLFKERFGMTVDQYRKTSKSKKP